MSSRSLFTAILAVLFALVFSAKPLLQKIERRSAIREVEQVAIPPPTEHAIVASSASSASSSHRREINWSVPFTSQAPMGDWDPLHQEACEEASIAMVVRYFEGRTFSSPADADDQIRSLVATSEQQFGFGVSQNVQQVAALLTHYSQDIRISIVADPHEESLKEALDHGFLVIVPAAGRALGNPYYRSPGPLYHMLVLRGYTSDGYVITNDPGTKHGEQFVYRWETLLAAIHDWNDGNVEEGKRVVIMVGKYTPGLRLR